MRIAIITQHFPPENSGNASRVSDMAENLAANGVEVTVVAPHPSFPTGTFPRSWRMRRTTRRGNVTVVNLWAWQPRANDPGFVSRIAYYLSFPVHAALWALTNPRKYDIIVGSMPPIFTGLPGLAATSLYRRKRFVVEVRDLWIDAAVSMGFVKEKSLFTRMSRALERRCYRRASLIGVTTDDVARKIRARQDLGQKPVVVVPNGVDASRFTPREGPKKPQFVYAGNVGHAQDLEPVILAMRLVRASHPSARLVIVGGGDTLDRLKAFTAEQGLDEAVIFLGIMPREQVPALIAESAAGLAPLRKLKSLEYAVPTKAYECLSAGNPFIGTGEGEIERLAKESGAGLIADNTPNDVARAMIWVLDNPEQAAAMGRRGRAFVAENYDRGTIVRRYLARLKEVIPGVA